MGRQTTPLIIFIIDQNNNIMGINMSKVCNNCKQTKSTIEFSKDKSKKDNLNPRCKQCDKYFNKLVRNNNPKYMKEWNNSNKEKVEQYRKDNQGRRNQYEIERRKDPTEKIKHHLKVYISQTIKNIGATKHKKTLNIVGLDSWDLLREHIEKQWVEGMTWNNHGHGKDNTTWHIDHIIPISSATTEDEVYKLNHYTNLRPMWGSDNIRKSNKI